MRKLIVVVVVMVVLGACERSDGARTPGAAPARSPSSAAEDVEGAIDGTFDVGGHELYLSCTGSGSPTVVFIHGAIPDVSADGFGHPSGYGIQDLLDERYRTCVYDRANVGLSDDVEGPLDGKDTATDLHELLEAAEIEPPYVLLGSSFGTLVAEVYAGKFPDEVAGMVLLDGNLPDDYRLYDEFFSPKDRLRPDGWKEQYERIDEFVMFRQAEALMDRLPRIPATYLAAEFDREDLDLLATLTDRPDDYLAAWERNLRGLMAHFDPGRWIWLDTEHDMATLIPGRVAREVARVIELSEVDR